jgi:hypothetical protein
MMRVYTVVQHRIGQLDGCHADGRCRLESRERPMGIQQLLLKISTRIIRQGNGH